MILPPDNGICSANSRISCQLARVFTAKCRSKLSREVENSGSDRFAVRQNEGCDGAKLLQSFLEKLRSGGRGFEICLDRGYPHAMLSKFPNQVCRFIGRTSPGHTSVVGSPISKREVPATQSQRPSDSSADSALPPNTCDERNSPIWSLQSCTHNVEMSIDTHGKSRR